MLGSKSKEPSESRGLGGRSTCKVLFWNIHGQTTRTIGNKFDDQQFLNVCKDFDILGLAELHTNSSPSIRGFKLIKDKIRKKLHKGPKISGGIAVFARKEIAHMIKPVPTAHEDSIWVKINKEKTGEARDVYVGTCYVSPPPRNANAKSTLSEGNDKHSSIERFFEVF